MTTKPDSVARFLEEKRIAVAGVSRQSGQAANAVFKKLKSSGYDAVPVNPNTATIEGVQCYPDLVSIPGELRAVVIATHPGAAAAVVRQCKDRGVKHVWFHRSFGEGSVSPDAVRECERLGLETIVGGCPLMFGEPVDMGHRCMRWWLQRNGRVPK